MLIRHTINRIQKLLLCSPHGLILRDGVFFYALAHQFFDCYAEIVGDFFRIYVRRIGFPRFPTAYR
nr:MAG TPA: hypothetical protein [Caudoviricetes sp.]